MRFEGTDLKCDDRWILLDHVDEKILDHPGHSPSVLPLEGLRIGLAVLCPEAQFFWLATRSLRVGSAPARGSVMRAASPSDKFASSATTGFLLPHCLKGVRG